MESFLIKYVCGFMFDNNYQNVALIRKNKPEWQKGFLNGIGGKIEFGETIEDAMIREFKEETGFDTSYDEWFPFAEITQKDEWCVYFFHTRGNLSLLKTVESEEIVILPLKELFESKSLPSVKWLINLCLDKTHRYTISKYDNP